MITLIYLPGRGWEKQFNTVEDFKAELWRNICFLCRQGEDCDPELYPPLTENSLIVDMMSTACGWEFYIEDPDELLTPLS